MENSNIKFSKQENKIMQAFNINNGMLGDDDLKKLGYDPSLDLERLEQIRHRLKTKLLPSQTIEVSCRGSKKSNLNPVISLINISS